MNTPANQPEPLSAELRSWLGEQLQVDAGASESRWREAILRRLAEEDFLPPEALASAMVPSEVSPTAPVLLVLEERLKSDVAEFEKLFFGLEISDRSSRFLELEARCQFSPYLKERLSRLRMGLKTPAPNLVGDREVDRLMIEICRTFTMPPERRASHRFAFLSTCEGEEASWAAAAKKCRRQRKDLAALAPVLLEAVERLPSTARKPERPRGRPSNPAMDVGSFPSRGPEPTGSERSKVPWFAIAILGTILIRACAGGFGGLSSGSKSRPGAVRVTPAQRQPKTESTGNGERPSNETGGASNETARRVEGRHSGADERQRASSRSLPWKVSDLRRLVSGG